MAVLRWLGGTLFMSRSPNQISPASGWWKPAMALRVVVLPQPDGPSRVRNSPSGTSRLRSSTASTSSKRLVRLLMIEGRHDG